MKGKEAFGSADNASWHIQTDRQTDRQHVAEPPFIKAWKAFRLNRNFV
jgi:hypothetical protein